jgi:hypothetical protein
MSKTEALSEKHRPTVVSFKKSWLLPEGRSPEVSPTQIGRFFYYGESRNTIWYR